MIPAHPHNRDAEDLSLMASQLLFCQERLTRLSAEGHESSWLWGIREKVVRFIVGRYHLDRHARSLSESEQELILKHHPLLQPGRYSRESLTLQSDEVRRIRRRMAEIVKRLKKT